MGQVRIDCLKASLKSALRNLKSAILICAILFAVCSTASAQQQRKIPHVGYLTISSLSSNVARVEAFRRGMRELGYVEGKNIVIEWRSGDGKVERQSELAAEVVRLKVNAIVTSGPTMTRAAKQATATIPIVMAFDPDPVGNGFIAGLARPGGNITGLSSLSPDLSGKQLELLKEIIPKLSRLAVLGSSAHPGTVQSLREMELAAGAFKVQLQRLDVLDPKEIETRLRSCAQGSCGRSPCSDERCHQFSSQTDRRTRGKKPATGDILQGRICGSRRADDLWRERCRLVSVALLLTLTRF